MLRSIAAKVVWVGRTASVVFGLALVLALLLGVASMALAGTGVGAVFNLGVTNTVNAITQLVSPSGVGPNGPMLRIDNNGKGTAATGLEILTEAGKPPMKVSSQAKVTRLNADRLDGRDATMWAKVAANGEATASYGVSTSSKTPMDGSYKIQFIRDTSRCATTATLAADNQGGDVYASGGFLPEPNAVLVETFDSRGIRVDRPFSLAVFC